MRILYISTEEVGAAHGGGVHTWETARHLGRLGHTVHLVTPAAKGLPPEETRDGVRVLRLPMRLLGRSFPARLLLSAPRLAKLDYDVVMSRWSALGGAEPSLARRRRVPWVIEINNPHAEEVVQRGGLGRLAGPWLVRRSGRLGRKAQGAVTPNARIAPAGVPVLEIPWGVDTKRFHPRLRADGSREAVRRELGVGDRPTALFTGTFRPWHGAHLVPEIAQTVLKTAPDAVFLLAGDGPARPRVEAEAARRGLGGSVRLLGSLPYARIPGIAAAADVGIAPFAPEENPLFKRFGFYYSPLKIFEYMASGMPTVTFSVPPLDAIVEGAGRAAPPGDLAAFAQALAALLGDAPERERLGRGARSKAEREYGWDVHASRLETFLSGLIGRKSSG